MEEIAGCVRVGLMWHGVRFFVCDADIGSEEVAENEASTLFRTISTRV